MPARPIKETGSGPQPGAGGSWWNPLDWFQQQAADWLGGLGGDIASGIEGGVVAVFKDMFGLVLPWVEIIIGALIILWAFVFYFKDDIAALAGIIARAV